MPDKTQRALFASDLHGNRNAYEQLFAFAEKEQIKTVILGGDLTPKWPILQFRGGAVVPLIPWKVRPDENGKTYAKFLGDIAPMTGGKVEAAVAHFVNKGGYVLPVDDPRSMQQLLNEQRALEKAIRAFDGTRTELKLFPEEWKALEDLIEKSRERRTDMGIVLHAARFEGMTIEQRKQALEMKRTVIDLIKRSINARPRGVSKEDHDLVRHWLETELQFVDRHAIEANPARLGSFAQTVAMNDPLRGYIEDAFSSFDIAAEPQQKFLRKYLMRRCIAYKERVKGGKVYSILGNDDHDACYPVVEKGSADGVWVDLTERVVELAPGVKIAGYPYVPDSHGRFYAAWERSEREIERDLERLESQTDGAKTIYVVHTPPADCKLDTTYPEDRLKSNINRHEGSHGVRAWLAKGQKHLVLSGHIHEAPKLSGAWNDTVEGTLCMNAGGEHDKHLQAIIFNIENPADARWIHSHGS